MATSYFQEENLAVLEKVIANTAIGNWCSMEYPTSEGNSIRFYDRVDKKELSGKQAVYRIQQELIGWNYFRSLSKEEQVILSHLFFISGAGEYKGYPLDASMVADIRALFRDIIRKHKGLELFMFSVKGAELRWYECKKKVHTPTGYKDLNNLVIPKVELRQKYYVERDKEYYTKLIPAASSFIKLTNGNIRNLFIVLDYANKEDSGYFYQSCDGKDLVVKLKKSNR